MSSYGNDSIPSPIGANSKELGVTEVRKWVHDVRNAINSIMLCTSAFQICPGEEDRLELVDQIALAADRMDHLIDAAPAGAMSE